MYEGILMNINQLYAFTAVYETGNFSESARKLKLTQSAITQLIHSLEKDLDTLFLFVPSDQSPQLKMEKCIMITQKKS